MTDANAFVSFFLHRAQASRQIIEKYYSRLTLDFATNKRIADDIAIIPSKRLRNKIAGFTTVRMNDENVFADDAGAMERIVERRAGAFDAMGSLVGFGEPVGSREGGGPRTRAHV